MKNARMSGPPVGDTLIDFLRRAVERYGPRDALLFKPAFRYQRWSYWFCQNSEREQGGIV